MSDNYRICKRCISDSNIPGINFDEKGECSYCKIYDEQQRQYEIDTAEGKLEKIIEEISKAGKDKKYDCIVGVSGGQDSTYSLYMAKKLGLRPLAAHFDNGWNSEISVSNINNAISKLGVDLYTYVVDWEEFKDLQLSFLKASVPDAEIPTDIGIKGMLYRKAIQEGIKYIIYEGSNFRTEGKIPQQWVYMDGKYIKSVQEKIGNVKLKSFPNLTLSNLLYYTFIKKIKTIRLLKYLNYKSNKVFKILESQLDWRYYGGKHFESVYTKFFQSYILPTKFNIDKRKVHYSSLIRSGQMTRREALDKIKNKPYSEKSIEEEKEYICKKLELTKEKFEYILDLEPKTFMDYPNYYTVIKNIKFLKKLGLWPQTM